MAQSIHSLFLATVKKRHDKTAAQLKVNGAWRDVTWGELATSSQHVSAALVNLGVKPKEMVCVVANTRYEWIVADLGVLGAGATTVPIYQSSTPDDSQYIANDCGAVAIIVEDDAQLAKFRALRPQLPNVKKLIAMTGNVTPGSDWEVSWETFLADGAAYLKDHLSEVEARSQSLDAHDILTIIYTSGTTGRPKGAVLTHDAMLYESEAITKTGLIVPEDVQYMFLPMAHVFAKVLEATWIRAGHVMAFWEGDMKKIVDNLAEVRPTMMASVPRIFEKVYAKVVSDVQGTPGVAGKIAQWGLHQGHLAAQAAMAGRSGDSIPFKIAKKLVWSKLHTKLDARFGGRMRFFISGGAPLSKDIAYFFHHAGFKICEGYGLTETSAATCVNLPDDIRIGTVGRPLPGMEIKIAADNEILVRGRGVMKGYFNRPDATAEALSPDGWFHTGDIGMVDKDGFLSITDRKKDIIVTAGGKNVAPQNLENLLKSKSPLIAQAVVHGDKRKFLSLLVTIDEENATKWAKDNGVPGDYKAITQSSQLNDVIGRVVKDVNSGLASYESLKKFRVLEQDFVVGDELTASLKMKRKHVNEKYKALLDSLYEGEAGGE